MTWVRQQSAQCGTYDICKSQEVVVNQVTGIISHSEPFNDSFWAGSGSRDYVPIDRVAVMAVQSRGHDYRPIVWSQGQFWQATGDVNGLLGLAALGHGEFLLAQEGVDHRHV